ncbi:MAG TPA: hypothetical protein VMZ11_07490 [Mycobacteriales bacterium]|nr:hypothetical protein [Mycobacteriales bacterium]
MSVTVAVVPSAPLLLLDGAPADLLVAVKAAAATLSDDVVVVGAAPAPGWWQGSVDLTPYGVPGEPAADPLPLALAVGSHVLGDRPRRLWGVPSGPLPEAPSYLVVADGTARRTLKAPGHLDERAEAFDAAVVHALASGSGEQLLALDPALAEELWVQGMPALRALAGLGGPWRAEVAYAAAPFGVGYVVATWAR